jgi:hypothetical protein
MGRLMWSAGAGVYEIEQRVVITRKKKNPFFFDFLNIVQSQKVHDIRLHLNPLSFRFLKQPIFGRKKSQTVSVLLRCNLISTKTQTYH